MSGEKVSSITVVPALLFGALGLLVGTAAMATGVGAVVAGSTAMAAGGAASGAVSALADRARARRASREAERAQREREALQRAQDRLREVSQAFEALKARATEIGEAYNGIALPQPPQFPEIDEKDAGAILASLADAEAVVTGYRNGISEAVTEFSRSLAADAGRDEALEWYGSYALARGAGVTLERANNERLLGLQAQEKEFLRRLFEDARKLMAQVDREVVHVSEDLHRQLGVVLSAGSYEEAKVEKAKLKHLVDRELERTGKEREQRQRERDNLQMNRVADLMAFSLEEMGYAVSGTDETAYVENGHIIAHSTDHGDHALRLTIDRENRRVTSNVIRLADPAAVGEGYQPTEEEREQDRTADASWCNAEQIGRFGNKLREHGIDLNFCPRGGDTNIEYVSIDDVLDSSPSLEDALGREKEELRARTHDLE